MEKIPFQFEDLPNELIMDMCAYLDAREVFSIFHNLNVRFKALLQSFNHLQLTVSLFDSDQKKNYQSFFPHIQTLIIERGIVNTNLRHFKYLRCLILHNPKEKIFEQIQAHIIFNIEYISITHKFVTSTIQLLITDLHKRIFSNHFHALKSCNLSDMGVSIPIENWQQSSTLYILKVGLINTLTYKAILSACPNLYFFQLKKASTNDVSSNINIHPNLKHLVINDQDQAFPWNDTYINNYLLCVPNLEKFTIHRTNFFTINTQYLNYDWLASILMPSLHLLRQFKFILHIYDTQRFNKCYIDNMFCALQEHCIFVHKNRYQVRLKFIQERF